MTKAMEYVLTKSRCEGDPNEVLVDFLCNVGEVMDSANVDGVVVSIRPATAQELADEKKRNG